MKGGHNPNRFQKTLLTDNGKNSSEWLYITQTQSGELVFKHKTTGEVIKLSAD